MEADVAKLRNNPFFVISIALFAALSMSAVSILMYYRSETREIVEQIQQNNSEIVSTSNDNQSISEELSESYIESLEKKIASDITNLSTESDYNPDELTDAALGF